MSRPVARMRYATREPSRSDDASVVSHPGTRPRQTFDWMTPSTASTIAVAMTARERRGSVTDHIRIDDLAAPTFTPMATDLLAGMGTLAGDCPLTSEAVHRRAADETGLRSFGPKDYEERLVVLLEALRSVPDVTDSGRVGFFLQIVQLLKNRLLLTDLLVTHPEITSLELEPPVVIVGLPRTGTTHLHNLLAADPGSRSLPYWESLEPVPTPAEVGAMPDPRRERTDAAVWFINETMPLFPLMHEMTTDHVHEEIQLLAVDFSTMFFETLADVPGWRAYYQAHDQTPHYRYLRVMLQALQFLRPGGPWVLKSPQHLEQLGPLNQVFPDAVTVVTHRDPVAVTVSMATMIAYSARTHTDHVDPIAIGSAWANRIHELLSACMRDRALLPAERSMDLRFGDFMADESGALDRIYALAGRRLSDEARSAMTSYLAGHQRGRLGSIAYRAEDVGLDVDELTERFRPYVERFL